jgi:hypothetical protein
MSETPRTDAIVKKAEQQPGSFLDAYLEIRELARELERENNQSESATPRKRTKNRPA